MTATSTIAFLADGKLYRATAGGEARQIESEFIRTYEERRALSRERNSFRNQGMMWNFNSAQQPMAMAEMPIPDDQQRPLRFTGVCRGPKSGEMFYSLQTDLIGGLFHFDAATGYERRLLHRQQLDLRDLAISSNGAELACTLGVGGGATNIGVMDAEGGKLKEVTSGDSMDEAPSWVAGRGRTLVFQTAGIGRHENGMIFGFGPCAISQLDLETGDLKMLLEHEAFDYIAPRMSADGALYYIRRPYQLRAGTSPLKVAGDIAAFPFRMARAVVHFFNAFSMFFSRKPLITSGGPQRQGPDKRAILLWGRWVEVDRSMRYAKPDADPPLVPSSWTLVRRTSDGDEETLATGVVAYDLADDGTTLHTNGSAIYLTPPGGTAKRVARSRFVDRVKIIAQ